MGQQGPFRTLVALLLAAWMPFCCCSLRLILDACAAGPRGPTTSPACHEVSSPCHGGTDPAPGAPAPDDHGPCPCGKDRLAAGGVEKAGGVESPAVAPLCVLPGWGPAWAPRDGAVALERAAVALRIPAASLLRLHCALII